MNDPSLEEVGRFLSVLKHAENAGVEYEFVQYFLRDFMGSSTMDEAINYAAREWDI